jgi:hypothetical protein
MLRNAEDYYIPAHRVKFVKRLPLFTFPAAWNNAPGETMLQAKAVYMTVGSPGEIQVSFDLSWLSFPLPMHLPIGHLFF